MAHRGSRLTATALTAIMGLVLAVNAIAADGSTTTATVKRSHRRSRAAADSGAVAVSGSNLVLYSDPVTGQLFTKPGPGRTRMVIPTSALEMQQQVQEVQQKAEAQARAVADQEIAATKADLQNQLDQARVANAAMASEVQQMQPAWREFGDRWFRKIKIGTLFYGDYAFYSHTGYGPQFLTQINPPGPGNNAFNSFDITRTYLNFFFSPTEDFTLRITPNMYREQGNGTAFSQSRTSAIASNLNGNLGVRIKYAYLDYNTPFKWSEYLKEDKITFGQQPNPLVAWEEDLWGYRYVTLTPWNYTSLSSSQVGLSVHGPIKYNELQWVDYDVGAYNNASFHAFEQTSTKQVMGRVSFYPLGARSRFDGLGLTYFYDYGYNSASPDNVSPFVGFGAAKDAHIMRMAALAHYSAAWGNLIFEYDQGHNAFTSGNLFSATGPPAEFGLGANTVNTQGVVYDAVTRAFQNNGQAVQQGFDALGHYNIPHTSLSVFGLFEWNLANVRVSKNPNDFQRWVAGVEYKYNQYLRFALDSQNLLFYHNNNNLPGVNEISSFDKTASTGVGAVTGITPAVLSVWEKVPRDTHAIFLNVEFAY